MWAIGQSKVRLCEGMTRRHWLQVGALGVAGPTLADLCRGWAAATPPRVGSFGRARSCIVCFLFGAPAHQDIWDLKPDAPADIRGEFRPIASSVPGLLLGEHI